MAFTPDDKKMLEGYIQKARPFEEMFSVSREVGQDYLGSRPKKKDTAGLLKAVCTPYVR